VPERWGDGVPLFLLLKRRVLTWWSKAPWLTLCAVLGVLYWLGFALIHWSEPPGNPIRSLPTYTYFFLVTVTTVGYGDVVPLSTAGRFTAGMIAIGGIGAAAVALGSLFSSIGNLVKRREKGFGAFAMRNTLLFSATVARRRLR